MDTYANNYGFPSKSPGIYAIVLMPMPAGNDTVPKVLYIGKSRSLYNRISGHPVYKRVLKAVNREEWHVARFFFEVTEESLIHSLEKEFITSYDPRLNIQGKKVNWEEL